MTDKMVDRSRESNRPPASGDQSSTAGDKAAEPAQGHIDTQTRYRDRPTDDGKYGDGGEQPS